MTKFTIISDWLMSLRIQLNCAAWRWAPKPSYPRRGVLDPINPFERVAPYYLGHFVGLLCGIAQEVGPGPTAVAITELHKLLRRRRISDADFVEAIAVNFNARNPAFMAGLTGGVAEARRLSSVKV